MSRILSRANPNNVEVSENYRTADFNTNELNTDASEHDTVNDVVDNSVDNAENCEDSILDENSDDFVDPTETEYVPLYPNIDIDSADLRVLHPYTDCTAHDAYLMVYAYAIRHDLTWTATEDILRLMNFVIGREELKTSKYIIKKKFRQNSDCKPVNHFFCHQCGLYFGDSEQIKTSNLKLCPSCNADIETDTKYKKNHFVAVPFREHMQQVLERNSRHLKFDFTDPIHGDITDVHDSICFRKLRNSVEVPIITLTFNTDGAKVFESTKDKSLWPLQFIINEIPLEYRFKKENIFCAGFAFGKTPKMQVFLKPFIEEINKINDEGGLNFQMKNGQLKRVQIHPMIFTGDAPARAYVLNKVQFNGYKGCPFCLHNGTLVNGQIRYCKRDNGPLRTNEQTRDDMLQAQIAKNSVNGYHGVSALMAFCQFDVVKQIAIDVMHNIHTGVTHKFFDLVLDKKSRHAG